MQINFSHFNKLVIPKLINEVPFPIRVDDLYYNVRGKSHVEKKKYKIVIDNCIYSLSVYNFCLLEICDDPP